MSNFNLETFNKTPNNDTCTFKHSNFASCTFNKAKNGHYYYI